MAWYFGRGKPDLMFTIKEFSKLFQPTLTALARLGKMIGYFKFTGDLGVHLHTPDAGSGERKKGSGLWWLLHGYADAD